jgi:2-polyprenyl-3-methyl-5-hydroxy-6-metoxy-1,4-benzoquinol methylase
MNVQQAYNIWADQYDTNQNRTRDLEGVALREILRDISFKNCLEIGCGTGKNTEWFITKTDSVTSVDLSEEMLSKAKTKINSDKVQFIQADITKDWDFATKHYDLVSFSLVLEHIENLENIFEKIVQFTHTGSYIYVGELHSFKQYAGTKARFETEAGTQIVTCFNHNISDFTQAAKRFGFEIMEVNEYFDDNDRTNIPRILILVFRRK